MRFARSGREFTTRGAGREVSSTGFRGRRSGRQGKLLLATPRDVASWSGDKQEQSRLASYAGMGRVYVVLDEVTLPAGLFGGHRRDFIIPPGVPKPRGPKGHCNFYYLKDHTFE